MNAWQICSKEVAHAETVQNDIFSFSLAIPPENEWLMLNGGEKVCNAFQIKQSL